MRSFVVHQMMLLQKRFITVFALEFLVRIVRFQMIRKLNGVVKFQITMWTIVLCHRVQRFSVFAQIDFTLEALTAHIAIVGVLCRQRRQMCLRPITVLR